MTRRPMLTPIDALCDDCLASILVRLPSTSVLHCRAVCRSWRRITTDRSFLADLAARHPLQILTRSVYFYGGRAVSATPLSVDDDPRPPAPESRRATRGLFQRTQYEPSVARSSDVLFSLDGLLVLSQCQGIFVICNPATRQWASLPVLAPDEPRPRHFDAAACGFYSHASSGEYRLLCQVKRNWARDYYILSAGTGGGARRRHGRRAPRPANRSRTIQYSTPVLSRRGVLHWLDHPEADYTGKMLAFDTVSEAFRLMPLPPPERAGGKGERTLVEQDGELAMAVMHKDGSTMAVWDLRGYGEAEEVWTLRYRVEMPPPSSLFGNNHVSADWPISWFFPVGGCAIMIGQGYCGFAARLYDLKEKRIRGEVSFLPRSQRPAFLVFRESLVSHAFFNFPPNSEIGHMKFSDS